MKITSATVKERLMTNSKKLREYRPPFIQEAPDAIARKMGFVNWDNFNQSFLFGLRYAHDQMIGVSAAGMMKQFVAENDPDDVQRKLSEYIYLNTTLKVFYDDIKNLRILQLACNYGPYLHFLSHQEGANISGVDIAKAAVEYARESGLDVRFGRADDMPFKDKEFDAVISKNFLCPFYINKFELDTTRIIGEIHRVLKPGGRYFSDSEIFLSERRQAFPPFGASLSLGPEFTTVSRWFSMITVMEKPAEN